jgi:hypothetical protein
MREPAAPNPDPGPATTRPRPSPNGTVPPVPPVPPGPPVPPVPPVPPMPSEVTKEHTRARRPAGSIFRAAMSPLRKVTHRPPATISLSLRAGGPRPSWPAAATRPPPRT